MNGINLVPNHYNKAYQRKWIIGLGTFGILLVTTVLIILAFIPINQIKQEEQRSVELDRKLTGEALEEVKMILQDIQNMNIEKDTIEQTLQSIDTPEYITRKTMDIIVNGAPDGFRMNEILMQSTEGTINIKGQAKQIKNVAEYIVYLHSIGQFENITYSTQRHEELGLEQPFEYNIQFQIKSLQTESNKVEQSEETSEESGGEEL